MKKNLNFFILLLAVINLAAACKKQAADSPGSSGSGTSNRLLTANAGLDQTVFFPSDSVILNGGGKSTGGVIVNYRWTRISGPLSYHIDDTAASVTKLKQLVTGIYEFELKVTDNRGLSAKDSVSIVVKTNKRPVADAGSDQLLFLPITQIVLTGRGTDTDGSVVSYEWTKISGPISCLIVSPGSPLTSIQNLVLGSYEFQLKVTDNNGLSGADTVMLVVHPARPNVHIELVPVGNLSIVRGGVAVAAAGNKIYFAGGFVESPTLTFYKRIDVYDIATTSWSTLELTKARAHMAAVTVGDKILFAGGSSDFDYGNWSWEGVTSRVDIYDISTGIWSTTELPQAMHFLHKWYGNCEVSGNKAYFIGPDKVQIYDAVANTWTAGTLGIVREQLFTTTVVDNNILVGGVTYSNPARVDIYNTISQAWSAGNLSEGRDLMRAGSLNNKAFFAGGGNVSRFSSRIDIFNNASHTWTVAHLSQAAVLAGIAGAGQKMLFFGGRRVDVYNMLLQTWEISNISEDFSDGSSFITAANNVYATKGNQVWRIQF